MTSELPLDAVRTFVRDTLPTWGVPGAAVTIVREGQIVLCEGFGMRNVEQQQPVTPRTLFPIASCTKAFTAMSLGILADEGAIEWDRPVREYLPAFSMHDPVATARITPRDLVTHRSGLPRHDLVWYASNFSRREVFARLKHLELSKDLRTTFQYNNIMFMVAGLLVAELTGMSWERFVQARIFDTLGMTSSTFSTLVAQRSADFATPYRERDGTVLAIPFYDNDGENDAVGPAGNIVSCVADLAHWLQVQTSDGAPLVAGPTLREMHTPQMVLSDAFGDQHLGYSLSSYGLGWFLHAYKGQVLAEHGGNLDGFSSLTSVVPASKLGMVVLCNGDGTALPTVITHQVYDWLLELAPTDWSGRLKPLWDAFRAGEHAHHERSASERQADAPPSHPLAAYVGEYEHPGYGVLAVQPAGDGLQLVINEKITLPLSHYHYDYFEAYWETWDSYRKLAFGADSRGRVSRLTIQMEPAVKDAVFVRRPERQLTDPAYLAQFVGDYEALGMPLVITLRQSAAQGAALAMTFAGGPAELLVPYQGSEFQLKDRSGFSVEFLRDAAGNVSSANIVQPEAVFTATRQAAR
jgi:CubicO group peptidase (beta-lactamase class C family)